MQGSLQAVMDSVARMGGSDQQLVAVANQLQQMAARGRLATQDLSGELTRTLPGAFQALASTAGVTYGELVNKISTGSISSKEAIRAMLEELGRQNIGGAAGEMDQYTAQLTVFKSTWEALQQTVAQSGFLDAARDALRDLNAALQTPEAQLAAQQLGQALADLVQWLQRSAQWAYTWRNELLVVGEIAGVILGLAAATRVAMAATAALTTIIRLAGIAFRTALGPIGLIAFGLYELANAFGLFDSGSKADKLPATMDKLGDASSEGARQLQESSKSVDASLTRIRDAYKTSSEALDAQIAQTQAGSAEREALNQKRVASVRKYYDDQIAEVERGIAELSALKSTEDKVLAGQVGAQLQERQRERDRLRTDRDRAVQQALVELPTPAAAPPAAAPVIHRAAAAPVKAPVEADSSELRRRKQEEDELNKASALLTDGLRDVNQQLAETNAVLDYGNQDLPSGLIAQLVKLDAAMEKLRVKGKLTDELKHAFEEQESLLPALELTKKIPELRQKTHDISLSLMDDENARRTAGFNDEVNRLYALKDAAVASGALRKDAEKDVADYVSALREKLQRDNENAVQKMARDWASPYKQMTTFSEQAAQRVNSFIDGIVDNGTFKFGKLVESMLADFAKLKLKETFAPLMDLFGSSLKGLFGRSAIGGIDIPDAVGSDVGSIALDLVEILHDGGIAGSGDARGRAVSSAMFAGAMRFHTGGFPGLNRNEVPAILQRGEGVFTQSQMAALGGNAANANVQVNVINKSGVDVDARSDKTRFDGEKFVLDVVLSAASRPGSFRDGLKGAVA
jgi:tape measure domain-containing protein